MAAGYSPSKKLELTIWYGNDGHYTVLEEQYAQALEAQIEELDLIDVTLIGAPWSDFRNQSSNCNSPAFLLGWPGSSRPASYLDAMSWLEYFIVNTDRVCSNYESEAMTSLYEQAREELDEAKRLEIYGQMQELWARDFPSLDLTQEARFALTLPNVEGVVVDAMGFLHYDRLSKDGG